MAELSRKDLRQGINKKQFNNLYLIYGEEKMYIKADTSLLLEKLMGKNPPEFNFHKFEKDYELDDIAVAVQVAPVVRVHARAGAEDGGDAPAVRLRRLDDAADVGPDLERQAGQALAEDRGEARALAVRHRAREPRADDDYFEI